MTTLDLATAVNNSQNYVPALTDREREILRLVATGASSATVAGELHVARKTVSNNLYAIYRKLNVVNRTQAVLTAIRLGLIDFDFGAPRTAAGAPQEGVGECSRRAGITGWEIPPRVTPDRPDSASDRFGAAERSEMTPPRPS